jgi:hypothetical protein
MKTSFPFLLLLFLVNHISLYAQSTFACPDGADILPESNCYLSCISCDGFDGGLISNNYNIPPGFVNPPPGYCAPSIDNLSYLPFVAGSDHMIFDFVTFNCAIGLGLQVGIYGTNDCDVWTQESVCIDQAYPGQPYILDAFGLVVGKIYYFVIDGFNGDFCEFQINVLQGSTEVMAPTGVPVIDGPDTICTGGVGDFTVSGVSGATEYLWEFNGNQIYGEPDIRFFFDTTGQYDLCVTPYNPCFGNGITTCKTIVVDQLPTAFIDETICAEDFPYQFQWQVFIAPGVYVYESLTPDGCIQEYVLNLEQYPEPPVTVIDTFVCNGESINIGGFNYTSPGSYTTTLSNINGCDSMVVVTLDVISSIFNNIGLIASSEYIQIGSELITSPGPFDVLLQQENGCDSLVIGFLELFALDTMIIDTAICEGEALIVGMDTVEVSGVYYDSLFNGNSFDTLLQYNLTVNPTFDTLLLDTICVGESYVVGDSLYTESGSYTNILPSTEGCDSTVLLDLFVLQPMDTITAQICEGETYTIGDSNYNTAGAYTDTIQGASGCQSIILSIVEVWPVSETFLTEQICEGDAYQFGTQVLGVSGSYTDTLTAVNGCDSIIDLDLAVIPTSFTSLFVSICPGEILQTPAGNYTSPGVYTETYVGTQGCDSIVDITLSWFLTYQDTIQESICEGDTLLWNNIPYTATGIYEQALTTTEGCDSTVTLLLDVNPTDTTQLEATICNGDNYMFGDSILTQSGAYEQVLTSATTQCDSIILLNLEVLPLNLVTIDTTICEGEGLVIGGEFIDQAGAYQFVLQDQFLCDSIVEVIMTIIPTSYTDIQAEICEGDSFEVGDTSYTDAGVYTSTLVSIFGCDSIVHLTLSVIPFNEPTVIDTTLCFGEIFEIGPYAFTDTVDNLLQFTGENGCDSLVHLQLGYYDEIVIQSVEIEADLIGGLPDGVISLTLAGGTAPYSYLWSNGRVSNEIDLLVAGEYFVIVTDARGCQGGFYFTVPLDPGILPEVMLVRTGTSQIKVSPNPFTTEIELEIFVEDQSKLVMLRLFNTNGQLIWEEIREENRFVIHPQIAAGLYWLVVYQNNQIIGVERILKIE